MENQPSIEQEARPKVKIWVVDDSLEYFNALKRTLPHFCDRDIELYNFPNSESAIEKLKSEEENVNPDIILMDGHLGSGFQSGTDAIKVIFAMRRDIKIVANSSDEKSNNEMLLEGADIAIKKLEIHDILPDFIENFDIKLT